MGYALRRVNTFLRSDAFDAWLVALEDKVGRARIAQCIRSAEHGNFGDCEPVGEGVSEMRIHVGPGYRVYFSRRGALVHLLLLGGDKSSQKRDIKRGTAIMVQFAPFDAADYLDDEETIAEYLSAALEDPKPEVLLAAVRDVARARGMAQLARDAGLGRESLYKALAPGAKPRYDTMLKVLHALGIKLRATPQHR